MKSAKSNSPSLVSNAIRIIAIILLIPYLYIGIKEVISPIGIDKTFGISLQYEEGLQYLSVVGARNIVLSLLGIFFAIQRQRTTLVAFFVAIALMAAMDCYLVSSAEGFTNHAIKHATFVLLMLSMTVWTFYSRPSRTKMEL